MLERLLNLLIAVAAACLTGPLLLNYPLGFLLPGIACLIVAWIAFFRAGWLFVLLPAVLPIVGFAPWTGWITFEELDLLILAAATGGYARFAFEGVRRKSSRTSILLISLATLFSVSVVVSMVRGFSDAGGFAFGWFQGYEGPMNSVRVGKSFFLALLLIPLLMRAREQSGLRADRQLALGMALGLAAASLAALWERLAFTDLLNFTSDYRTTALFWEMHVGGAALDGWLLLTFPFAIWLVRRSRNHVQLGLALALLVLAAYAALTTFSRGVYLALALSLPLLAWQTRHVHKEDAGNSKSDQGWPLSRWLGSIVLSAGVAYAVFPSGGYRSLLAMLGLVAVSLPMLSVVRRTVPVRILAVGLMGMLAGGALMLLSGFVPRGPYLAYGILFSLTMACLYLPRSTNGSVIDMVCIAGYAALAAAAAGVANHWGGHDALLATCGALLLLSAILFWGAFSERPLWPNSHRWQGSFLAVAILVSALISVFAGGTYMGNRFATSAGDFESRISHWRQGLSMLQSSTDFVLGKGLGRFPANYYFSVPNGEFPGTFRIVDEGGNSFMSLVSPRHPVSFGNILRVSQRLDFDVQGPFRVAFKVRTETATYLHFEVCTKHLLYPASCAIGRAAVKPTKGQWQSLDIALDDATLDNGPWYAPRIKMFSFGIPWGNRGAELDDLELTSVGGGSLLANGNFSRDMQYWFFSSERDHLPWHAKNLWLNVLFDQGVFGLLGFLLLTLGALWRLNVGKARQHELSPYLTAAILGFQVVGLFDSLTDVPRVAFAYYLMVLYALSLRTPAERGTRSD